MYNSIDREGQKKKDCESLTRYIPVLSWDSSRKRSDEAVHFPYMAARFLAAETPLTDTASAEQHYENPGEQLTYTTTLATEGTAKALI